MRETRSAPGFAPFEHTTRVQALRDFVDWLYDHGPDPESVTRERLLHAYWDRVAAEAMQSEETAFRTGGAGTLVRFPGARSNPA